MICSEVIDKWMPPASWAEERGVRIDINRPRVHFSDADGVQGAKPCPPHLPLQSQDSRTTSNVLNQLPRPTLSAALPPASFDTAVEANVKRATTKQDPPCVVQSKPHRRL